jgi:hypothetical protein
LNGELHVNTDSVRLRVVVPDEVHSGTTVPIRLLLENTGTLPVELYLRGRTIAFDVIITNSNGATVWHRLAGKVIPAIVQLRELLPGEVIKLRTSWNQRDADGVAVTGGEYFVRGLLLTDAEPVESAPVHFGVASR